MTTPNTTMDTIQEVVTTTKLTTTTENAIDGGGGDGGTPEIDEQPLKVPAIVTDNDTTKSSQDSSFAVTEYNCSSLVGEGELDGGNVDAIREEVSGVDFLTTYYLINNRKPLILLFLK